MSQTGKPTAKVLSRSPIMARLLEQAEKVAKTDTSVLYVRRNRRGQGLVR